MSLLDYMTEGFVFMDSERVPDGSGGYNTAWTAGESFRAVVSRDTSTEARIAERAGALEMYTVIVPRSVHLPYHAVIKRDRDGKTFRVTSDNAEQKTPLCALLDMAQSTAEAWGLPE